MVLLDLTLVDYNPNVLGEMKNPIPYNNASTFLCNPGYCIDFTEKSSCGVTNEFTTSSCQISQSNEYMENKERRTDQ